MNPQQTLDYTCSSVLAGSWDLIGKKLSSILPGLNGRSITVEPYGTNKLLLISNGIRLILTPKH